MKKKVVFGSIVLVFLIIISSIYITKNRSVTLYETFQTEVTTNKKPYPIVSLVIDGDKFTEQTSFDPDEVKNSFVSRTGSITKKEKNAYILNSENEEMFLYIDGNYLIYYNPNIEEEVFVLKKVSDNPTYTTIEY